MEVLIQTEYFTLKEMADGMFAAIAKPGSGAWSNAGFVDLGTELLVFDAFITPSASRELKNQAEKLTGKKVAYLVNSHFHGDHVFGNQTFKEQVIISTTTTKEWINEKNAIGDMDKEQQETEQYLKDLVQQISVEENAAIKSSLTNQFLEMTKLLEELPNLELVLPSLTFEKNLKIHGTVRDVELYCLGGGHSVSDAFLYVPQENAAFMGDLITEDLHLPIYNPDAFLAILERVKTMDILAILPGHGEVGTGKQIDAMIEYVSMLISAGKGAHYSAISLEDFLNGFIPPEEYIKWKGVQGIRRNLATVYNFYAQTI